MRVLVRARANHGVGRALFAVHASIVACITGKTLFVSQKTETAWSKIDNYQTKSLK